MEERVVGSTVSGGIQRVFRRVLSGVLSASLVVGGVVMLSGAGVGPAEASPATVDGPLVVSAPPSQQSGGCTVDEVRATKRWWMLGTKVAMDFGTKGTVAPKVSGSPGIAVEGSTIVTDTEGKLRFWSNGIDVWGADGKPIKNSGGGLGKASSAQTVVAMPAMGAPGKYYVVTSGYEAEMFAEKGSLYYSVIDMNANNGLGEMTQKNIPLGTAGVAGEGLTAIENATGDGYWVYAVAANSNKIHRWEFKANGPVSKTPQSQTMTDTFSSYSTIHFDKGRGRNQGVVIASNLNIYTMVSVNRSTGLLTEGLRVKHNTITGKGQLYGAEFSPNGRYLYLSDIYGRPSHLYRVDLQAKTAEALRASRVDMGALGDPKDNYRSGGAVKMGPDGNLWVNDGYELSTLVKVSYPDSPITGSLGSVQRVSIAGAGAGAMTGWGLPDMVTGCEKRVPQITAFLSGPTDLTLGDAISPIKITIQNTGNTVLTGIRTQVSPTCPVTLAPGASMVCIVDKDYWGTVSTQDNGGDVIAGFLHNVSANGSIGADPVTGADRIVEVRVQPRLDLPIVRTLTLTYVTNGGTLKGPGSQTARKGSAWGSLSVATLDNNVFQGWYTAKTGGTQVTGATLAADNVTVYAQWKPIDRLLNFDVNGGILSGASSIVKPHGSAWGTLSTATRANNDFLGWYTAKTGGSQVTAASLATSSMWVYAQWTPTERVLIFDPNGGELVGFDAVVAPHGSTWGTLSSAQWENHDFQGWFTAKTGGMRVTGNSIAVADMTVYAQWKLTPRTLTFDPTGGTLNGPPGITKPHGSPWGTLSSAQQVAKVFQGWSTATTGGTPVTASTLATSSMTVYAQWRPAKFNVVFYRNEQSGVASGSMPSMLVNSGCTDCRLTANRFTKKTGAPALIEQDGTEIAEVDSKFLGWSLDPLSKTGDIADRAVAGGLSVTDGATVYLYAIWDDAPRFIVESYPNRYFNLDDAQKGSITEAELLSTVKASDKETVPLLTKTSAQVAASGNDVGITLYDYDASDYTSMKDSGVVSATYKVKDAVGNVAFLRIRVTVSNGASLGALETTYLRGITSEYAAKSAADGGFPGESLWLRDPTRQAALNDAFGGSSAKTFCLGADAVNALRTQVNSRGLGNSEAPSGLSDAASILREQNNCR